MRIRSDIKLDFSNVLITPKRSKLESRSQVSLERTFTFPNTKETWNGIPIMASNMDTVGTLEMARVLNSYNIITCLHKFYTNDDLRNPCFDMNIMGKNLAISTGISDSDMDRLDSILTEFPQIKFICIDIANGYLERFTEVISNVRLKYPNKILIAGNVVSPEMTEQLIMSGADIVKVGIGGGSVCTTRVKTGVGYPQLSAVIECSDAAHGLKGHIISDGGCSVPGDVAKAFCGGADFVMLGGMLAGHDESGGEKVDRDGKWYKQFYGMSSELAMKKHYGEKASYRSSEGREVLIPYKGLVSNTIEDILGGVRSTCTYIGADIIKNMPKCATFIQVYNQYNRVYENNNKI